MFCSKCGNEIKDGEIFCSKCGNKVKNIEDISEKTNTVNNDIKANESKEVKKQNKKKSKIMEMLDYNGKVNNLKELKKAGKITEKEFKSSSMKIWFKMFFGTIGFIFLITAILMGILIGKLEIDKRIEKSKEVQVPNIVGKTISEAEQELSALGLTVYAENTSLTTLYSGSPDAIIVKQKDEEGKILKKGNSVKVEAKTQEQIDKEKKEKEEKEKKQAEAREKGYRSSPATSSTIVSCAKTLVGNSLKSPSTAIWGKAEKVDEDNYGRCLVYVSVEAQNGFGGYIKSDYLVILQYVESNGEFTYKPYASIYELKNYGAVSTYDYYVSAYNSGNVYPVIQTFLDNNDWNTRPQDV